MSSNHLRIPAIYLLLQCIQSSSRSGAGKSKTKRYRIISTPETERNKTKNHSLPDYEKIEHYTRLKKTKTRKVAIIITMYCHLRPPDAIAFIT